MTAVWAGKLYKVIWERKEGNERKQRTSRNTKKPPEQELKTQWNCKETPSFS